MLDPNPLKLLSNNNSKFSASEPRCAQSIIAILSAAVSVLKTSNQKWLGYRNYAFPARNHRFENTGVDLFGPFFIFNTRKTEKHYGIIFNSLATRACHLESCSSMTTDSFLNAFRRFLARGGHPRLLRSDSVKNVVGERRELQGLSERCDCRCSEENYSR